MLRTILILGRVSNLPTVWTNVLAGWFMAGGGWTWELLAIEAGVSLLYVAGMTINDAFDAAWDRQHAPERPIPSGAISRRTVWILGFGQLAAGIALLIGLTSVGPGWVAALTGAILFYDWIHKKTVWSVAVMGACRGLVYLVASSAGEGRISFVAALIIILYVGGITLSARFERSPHGRPRLFLCWAAIILAMGMTVIGSDRPFLGVFVGMLPVSVWLAYCSQVGAAKGIGPMIGRLIAGITLLDAYFILVLGGAVSASDLQPAILQAALISAAFLPLTLLLQRKIPAT